MEIYWSRTTVHQKNERTRKKKRVSSKFRFELNPYHPLLSLSPFLRSSDLVSRSCKSGTGRKTYSSSKIAIIRCAKGLVAICGICKNSSFDKDPEPSLSNFIKRFLSRWISGAETTHLWADPGREEGEERRVRKWGGRIIGRDGGRVGEGEGRFMGEWGFVGERESEEVS